MNVVTYLTEYHIIHSCRVTGRWLLRKCNFQNCIYNMKERKKEKKNKNE